MVVPVLGAVSFTEFQRVETELLIIDAPRLVAPSGGPDQVLLPFDHVLTRRIR
jgi:Flp pilus assembly secretin CpaC